MLFVLLTTSHAMQQKHQQDDEDVVVREGLDAAAGHSIRGEWGRNLGCELGPLLFLLRRCLQIMNVPSSAHPGLRFLPLPSSSLSCGICNERPSLLVHLLGDPLDGRQGKLLQLSIYDIVVK